MSLLESWVLSGGSVMTSTAEVLLVLVQPYTLVSAKADNNGMPHSVHCCARWCRESPEVI